MCGVLSLPNTRSSTNTLYVALRAMMNEHNPLHTALGAEEDVLPLPLISLSTLPHDNPSTHLVSLATPSQAFPRPSALSPH